MCDEGVCVPCPTGFVFCNDQRCHSAAFGCAGCAEPGLIACGVGQTTSFTCDDLSTSERSCGQCLASCKATEECINGLCTETGSTVGIATGAFSRSAVAPGEVVTLDVTWTVPESDVWTDLEEIELFIFSPAGRVAEINWDGEANTFRFNTFAPNELSAPLPPGSPASFSSRDLELDVSRSTVADSGVDGRFVRLEFSLAFTNGARGHVTVDVNARDRTNAAHYTPDVASIEVLPGCTGDCGHDGTVTVNELITGVGITLGTLPLAECVPFDADDDLDVTIDELIAAVNNALGGCAAPPP